MAASGSKRGFPGRASPSAPNACTPRRSTSSRRPPATDRALAAFRGFVFDLDGTIWTGETLEPGAAPALAALRAAGRRVAFLTNNSRARARQVRAKLRRLGIDGAEPCLTPLEIIGGVIAERFGPSRVLVMGAPEMRAAIAEAGHTIVAMSRWRQADVVAIGNDFDLTYGRLAAATRAVAAGAPLVTPNVDPRLPIEGGDFLPGCGAMVAAVVAAAGRAVTPIVVGKPEPPLFELSVRALGLAPADVAVVGDSEDADVAGGRTAGLGTVLYAPRGRPSTRADVVVRSFAELRALIDV